MLSVLAKVWSGRALVAGAVAGAALAVGALMVPLERIAERPPTPPTAWTSACAERMEQARRELGTWSPEFGAAEVRIAESGSLAAVELALPPQYSARIGFDIGEADSVYDWEEAPTPVVGSFALHRRVGHFDLMLVADDSDERGLRFAAMMQPLLDACLMEAR